MNDERNPTKVEFALPAELAQGFVFTLRSISRVAGVSINTVTKLLVDAGTVCAAFHDEKVRDVKAKRIQL